MAGTMRRSAGGFGFVLLDDRKEEIFIPKSQMNHAIDKDRVLIRLMSERRGNGVREVWKKSYHTH